MPKSAKQYGNESISALKGADRVRKRPGVIFGSDGLEGCEHAVFEILSNAIDEAREGHGSLITVTRYEDKSIEVEDFGRGCPVDWNEKEQKYNWELVFCELYAGGKYNTNDGDNYEYSLGLNGLGSCATQYASEYFDAVIHRDGLEYTLHFEKGENIGGLQKAPHSGKKTGSKFRWKPDLEVFTDIDIPVDYYRDVLKRQAVVNAGVTFRFRNQAGGKFETTEFRYENGIVDYVSELAGENPLTAPVFWQAERKGRDRADKPEYKVKLSVSFCFSNTVQVIEHYHNSSWLEHGGSPEKAVKSAFVSAIDGYLKAQGKYQKSESKITWNDIQDCLVLVSNNFSTQTSYENQTKKAINNKFIQDAMTEFLKSQMEVYFIENPFDAGKIAEQVLINKRSRESAEKARLNIKKKLSGSLDIANRVQKFVDCRSKDTERRELYIVEGDSALGSVKLSRDAEFQGIMPVRGKILNCLKADYAKIFKSEIITDLLKVMGCGVEVNDRHAKDMAAFDLMNLRWSKIVICTDADVDGFQIRTLILTMLYRLTPTLIQRGYVYIAESPLYEINYKEKTWFAYSDKEKNDILGGELRDKKCIINRSKGLGENEPEMMWLTTMNPATRRLIRVMPEDVTRTAQVFDLLLGDNLTGRKTHIADNGYKYLELADIS
ncbi:DNA gyrase subunit B [uncultured Flavonifractor sp.]|jgi:DNA gyrase subunit B|uniref:DNA topoisomerase (ATP-hydrolyzing) n=1 Tax=Intestinimonas massiliensis (ex Afouda et al. 2020) TaxID=1673721 RepID=A0ABS9M7K2_9FIRM|nr:MULTISPECIES: toprim domain-containing protein [Intestinimonas]CUP99133.1 type IIA topoisomerase (DNA gyrase/topo II%2C topoisomerase IV)%2C B subunit [Flavonifractor plautii]SCJ34045.1 DNA gyrase subunit B [uncultured Flavonifractor sp.]BDE86034.1 DNA gyrase subunit B [Oscillospiraceae bacterium]MCG4526782.1 toprim domain-containing protein [Intestinimonas massiliensis (ex Afouda et al. 2020)]MCI5563492.1 toprim domain-containing protein [Intestinimonas massiliensis (ex Afouda et al. 2020)